MAHANNPQSDTLKELAQAKEEARQAARSGGNHSDEAEELPAGSSPLEASAETTEDEEETPEEASEEAEGESGGGAPAGDDDEGPVRIAGREFKSTKEAIAYAEEIEHNRLLTEAHAAGIREALEATRGPAQPDPEPEDDFEQRFYSDPKKTFKEVEERAVQKALGMLQADQKREKIWAEFLEENPDIRRKDAERILQENWDTIGKMTDFVRAQKTLALKVRAEYEEIRGLGKPRTELQAKKQTQSPGGGRPSSVTQTKKEERPLSMVEQMRKLKG